MESVCIPLLFSSINQEFSNINFREVYSELKTSNEFLTGDIELTDHQELLLFQWDSYIDFTKKCLDVPTLVLNNTAFVFGGILRSIIEGRPFNDVDLKILVPKRRKYFGSRREKENYWETRASYMERVIRNFISQLHTLFDWARCDSNIYPIGASFESSETSLIRIRKNYKSHLGYTCSFVTCIDTGLVEFSSEDKGQNKTIAFNWDYLVNSLIYWPKQYSSCYKDITNNLFQPLEGAIESIKRKETTTIFYEIRLTFCKDSHSISTAIDPVVSRLLCKHQKEKRDDYVLPLKPTNYTRLIKILHLGYTITDLYCPLSRCMHYHKLDENLANVYNTVMYIEKRIIDNDMESLHTWWVIKRQECLTWLMNRSLLYNNLIHTERKFSDDNEIEPNELSKKQLKKRKFNQDAYSNFCERQVIEISALDDMYDYNFRTHKRFLIRLRTNEKFQYDPFALMYYNSRVSFSYRSFYETSKMKNRTKF